MKEIKIAIAGNPNCGKTTLFNALTGSRQRVGNWPGVTVERMDGSFEHRETRVEVTDLPGIYSFSAYSIDETVAREHILNDRPDVVVNILDATNLERNLFLTTQLLEMHVPMVVALSMSDVAKKRRIKVEIEHLARHLGCAVIPVVGTKRKGVEELREAIVAAAGQAEASTTRVVYDSELERAIKVLAGQVTESADPQGKNARWLALKLLEQDEIVAPLLAADEALAAEVVTQTRRVEEHTGEDLDIVIADGRYGFIHGLCADVVHRDNELRRTLSDSIDKVMLNRLLGIPVFLAIMYLVFTVTINVGDPFIQFFDGLCRTLFVDGARALFEIIHLPAWLIALLADGLGGGVQTVATFVPPIFLIFLCLSFLEDSGYMARAAFVMDRFLRMIGLPGKAFIPMLVGFGCNVPAILATRTLENDRDRILTIMMNPFMSCGARLPVYTLFVAAFFPQQGGTVLFGIYFTGIVLAVLTGLLFKRTILAGEPASFVMELPPYHLPTFRGIMFHTWTRLKGFIIRAGKAILLAVVILGFLSSVGTDGSFGNQDSDRSALSAVARAISPVFRPLGVRDENWPAAVGLFAGLFAKEAVVGTLDTLYSRMGAEEGVGTDDVGAAPFDFWEGIIDAFRAIPAGFEGFGSILKDPLGLGGKQDLSDTAAAAEELEVERGTVAALSRYFDGKVGALAYMLFVLIYAPCVAAIAAVYRETNLRWATFSVFYLTSLAWIISVMFYQFGTFARHPGHSALWISVSLCYLSAIVVALKVKSRRLAPVTS